MLNAASVHVLEKRFIDAGAPAAAAHDERALSATLRALCEPWLDDACPALATTISLRIGAKSAQSGDWPTVMGLVANSPAKVGRVPMLVTASKVSADSSSPMVRVVM